jgi:hypothetical protein
MIYNLERMELEAISMLAPTPRVHARALSLYLYLPSP